MPGLLDSVFRNVKRRRQDGMRDDKTFRLYRAACRLLAERDHEQISVAYFAQAADMSVGAFYERFPNKDAFLSMVVLRRLSGMRDRIEQALDLEQWQHRSASAVTQAIVSEMMRSLHGHGAGVIRAALKRGHLDRTNLEPLLRYRMALANRAVALLAHRIEHVKKPERAVRSAMQIAEATALDALLHDDGALRPGSQQMATTLSAMMLRMLELSDESTTAAQEQGDEMPEPADDDGMEGMLDMPIEEVVALPIPEAVPVPPRSLRRQAAQDPVPPPIQIIRPRHAVKETTEIPEPSIRRRRRPKF